MQTQTKSDRAREGYFGPYGGQFVPETLVGPVRELTTAFEAATRDDAFWQELNSYAKHYIGRPTPLTEAARLTEKLGGARIYLKREDLNHTGAHKVHNTLGQVMLARRRE